MINNYGGLENFKKGQKESIIFETGYGPSGLPHIGTFGEVVRTTMVKNAFESLIDCKTKLVTFSDDMDGLRKVPENVPNKKMLYEYIGKPLTSIPDPFEKYDSFGDHNNAKLRSFLDKFNFDYDFVSSTISYKNGTFDKTIIKILENNCYQKVLSIGEDYRLSKNVNLERFLSPIDKTTNFAFNKYFRKITKGRNKTSKILEIKGRNLALENFYDKVVKFEFEELCNRNLGSEDYIMIAENCEFIFINMAI